MPKAVVGRPALRLVVEAKVSAFSSTVHGGRAGSVSRRDCHPAVKDLYGMRGRDLDFTLAVPMTDRAEQV
jgi:hypothetical protein